MFASMLRRRGYPGSTAPGVDEISNLAHPITFASAANGLVAEDDFVSLATAEYHIVDILLDKLRIAKLSTLLHGHEVQLLVLEHGHVFVVYERELLALLGVGEVEGEHVILRLALIAKRLVAEHEVDLLALAGVAVREHDSADFTGLIVEGFGVLNHLEVVAGLVDVLPEGVRWRLGVEVNIVRVDHTDLGLGVNVLNDDVQGVVGITTRLVDVGGHSKKFGELEGRNGTLVHGKRHGLGNIAAWHAG